MMQNSVKHELELVRWKITSMIQANAGNVSALVANEIEHALEYAHDAVAEVEYVFDVLKIMAHLIERLEYLSGFNPLKSTCDDILADCERIKARIEDDEEGVLPL